MSDASERIAIALRLPALRFPSVREILAEEVHRGLVQTHFKLLCAVDADADVRVGYLVEEQGEVDGLDIAADLTGARGLNVCIRAFGALHVLAHGLSLLQHELRIAEALDVHRPDGDVLVVGRDNLGWAVDVCSHDVEIISCSGLIVKN